MQGPLKLSGDGAREQFAPKTPQLWSVRDARAAGFSPGEAQDVVIGGAGYVQHASVRRESAVLDGVCREFVDYHCKVCGGALPDTHPGYRNANTTRERALIIVWCQQHGEQIAQEGRLSL